MEQYESTVSKIKRGSKKYGNSIKTEEVLASMVKKGDVIIAYSGSSCRVSYTERNRTGERDITFYFIDGTCAHYDSNDYIKKVIWDNKTAV